MPHSQSRGFSLTEILIALALILLFFTLPVLAFTQFSKKSRDDKRRSDLLTISQAIESYNAEKGFYPPDLEALVAEGYLPELPRDPRHGQLIPGETGIYYGYSYETDGETYTLSTRLENHVRGGGGGSGSGSLSSGNVSGRFIGTGSGAIAGFFTLRGVVSEGVLRANFTGTVSGNANGSISGSLSGQINGSAAGEVVGECALTSGVVTGTSFSGTYATCTLTPVAPSGGGPGVFIVKPRDLRGRDIPIAAITDSALTPTVVIPTKTPYLSPTRMVTGIPDPNRPDEFIPSPTPMPCTRTIVCAGACVQPQNRCGSYPSTKGGCLYTTRPNFATCRQVPAPDQPCTVTGDTCTTATGEHPNCSGTNCIPNCNTSISCSGTCSQLFNRCGTYGSTRSGCVYTQHTSGLTCQSTAAPDQPCTVTGDTCTTATGEHPNCSDTNCIPNCNTGASCTGVCQAITGRCAPNSYSSTRGGCTWTTFSGGGSCTPVAAPDQVCSITSQSCTSPPHCETSTSFCRNCLNNDHCPNPSAPRCSSYSCSACLGDADCARWPGRVCSASTGGCVEPTFSRAFTNNSFNVGTGGEMIVVAAKDGVSTYMQRYAYGDFSTSVYKFNISGAVHWYTGTKPATTLNTMFPRGLLATSDGGVLSVYEFRDNESNRFRVVLELYAANGGLVWRRVVGEPGSSIHLLDFSEIPPSQGGGFIMSGIRSAGNVNMGLLIRIHTNGTIAWQKHLGNTMTTAIPVASSYNPVGNNIVVVTSTSSSNPAVTIGGTGFLDVQLWRLDLSGNLQSAWTYGTPGTDFQWQYSSDVNPSDGTALIPVGLNAYQNNVLLKLSPNNGFAGSILWNRADGNIPDVLNAFADGSFAISRDGRTPQSHNTAVYNSSGAKVWERVLNPTLNGVSLNCDHSPVDRYSNGQYAMASVCGGRPHLWKMNSNGWVDNCSSLAQDTYLANYTSNSGVSVSSADVTWAVSVENSSVGFEGVPMTWKGTWDVVNSCN